LITFHFITEFDLQLKNYLIKGIFKRAHDQGAFSIKTHLLRQFAVGKHAKIDDYPFSQKKGMLLRLDVLKKALDSIADIESKLIIYCCPQGKLFSQEASKTLLLPQQDIVFISGYYKGVDSRLFDLYPIKRMSIGNYILNSGDSAAIVMAETLIRQLPGVLGTHDCINDDTFSSPFLEPSMYTHPVELSGQIVPDVLRSGNHNVIKAFKFKDSIQKTLYNRLDLCKHHLFKDNEKDIVTEILNKTVEQF